MNREGIYLTRSFAYKKIVTKLSFETWLTFPLSRYIYKLVFGKNCCSTGVVKILQGR